MEYIVPGKKTRIFGTVLDLAQQFKYSTEIL